MDSKQALTMESLDLPRELYWDMKLEPASPPLVAACELFALNDPSAYLIYDDNFANGIPLVSDEEEDNLKETGSMLSDEDFVVEFLDQIDEECLIDYKSTDFLDVVPQDMQPSITKVQVAANAVDFQQQGDSSSLILQQLTPPQSPPQFDAYQQQQQQQEQEQELVKQEHKLLSYASDAAATTAAAATAAAAYGYNNWAPYSEITPETQLVDDIVNMRAQELQLPIDWQQFNDDCESQASSSLGDSSISSNSGAGSSSSVADVDEEWLPLSNSSSPAQEEEPQSSLPASASSSRGSAKKRTRPYGRGVEDRKIRKKEQNKNAATRYRQKKKMEMEHVLGEEQELAQANEALRRTLSERRHESRYLRQLIREFYKERKQ